MKSWGLTDLLLLVLIVALLWWADSCYADACRARGGTTVTGGRNGTMCIEGGR